MKAHSRRTVGRWLPIALAAIVLFSATAYHTHRLTEWLAYDDEGGYLYAAWRITLGEVPYRDFLTPQMPGFLYPGALVLAVCDYSVGAARASMAALVLATGALLFVTVAHLRGGWTAFLAVGLFVVQRDVFWAARFFRPEAPMLFWGILGLYLFVRGHPQRRTLLLALSGACFGLAVMSKLFGALYVGGIGLFVLATGIRTRDWRDMLKTGLAVAIPFVVIAGGMALVWTAITPRFVPSVLGHHVRQGAGTPWLQVVQKTLKLYLDYVRGQPIYALLTALGLVAALRERDRAMEAPACLLATALAFMGMTRGLKGRHLTYLVPVFASFASGGLVRLYGAIARSDAGWPRTSAAYATVVVLLGAAVWPHVQHNRMVSSWEEHDTDAWVELIQSRTHPADIVMSDYPGLNFYARRATTPLAAGISRGAASSGQITGRDLIREIEEQDVKMVLLNVAQGAHQFARLLDYETFKGYVQTHFSLAERREFDYRLMEVYSRQDHWAGRIVDIDLGHQLALTGYDWLSASAVPGEQLQVALRWQARATMSQDYVVTLRLLDEGGHLWGMGGKPLVDVDRETYWDERGLERAVLVPTSQWPISETTIEIFELPVHLATPPGSYKVLARVHPEGQWAGLPILDASGATKGYDVTIGSAEVMRASEPPAIESLPIAERDSAEVAPGLALVGHTSPADGLRPGDRYTISSWWMASGPPRKDYALQIALRNAESNWSTAAGLLGGADLPSSQWLAGEVYQSQTELVVDPAAVSGEYELVLELLSGGSVAGEHTVGVVQISGVKRSYDEPAVGTRVDASLGEAISLFGYDLPGANVASGGTLPLTLYWRAEQRMDTSYTVFTHLIGGDGQVWGQQDNAPVAGTYPTTAWLPGEVIVDEYALRLKPDAPPGTYTLAVGLYDPETGIRLPISDSWGVKQEGDRLVLHNGIAVTAGP